jgi:starch synthase
MKGGITYADKVTTVSPTYAKEIKTPEFSFGLDQTIDQYKDKLFGVINGIEQESWNPLTDPHLFEPYPANSTYIQDILRKKALNKEALFAKLGISPTNGGPLVICITRLASQKSPELILKAISLVIKKGGCFILLGNICEKNLEKPFAEAKESLKLNPNVYLCYEFDNSLAHKLFAAADAIFIPSKFEPCGLTQMIAMHYGTIPIARNTGGLKDTINNSTSKDPSGFLFDELSEVAVDKILDTAFNTYFYDKSKWQTMIQNGIGKDYSWKLPSILYEHIYRNTLSKVTM